MVYVVAAQLLFNHEREDQLDRLREKIGNEWDLLVEKFSAAAAGVMETPATEASID